MLNEQLTFSVACREPLLTRVPADTELYFIHFPRRRINNHDMTKWKQTPNVIMAVTVPPAASDRLSLCVSDLLCAAPSVSLR